MKTSRQRHLTFAASCALLAVVQTRADDAALRPVAFQNGVNQQALSTETAELARAITELIDELQRNGFPIQSLSGLTELAAQLNSLGGTEMSQIASRLRKLGESAQADPRATATEAYVAQQAIENRLKTLARQISIQQLREETARRLETLITRQLSIQRETKAIASAKPEAERQRILESDQSSIGEDLITFFQTGDNLLSRLRENNTPAATPTIPGAAGDASGSTFAERINGTYLTTLSNEAVEHLKNKRYPDAHGRQESLIAELRKIHQGILSSLPKEQRLANALQQVSALRQQQEANQQAQTPQTREAAQAAADQAQNIANQVAPLSPEAAAELRRAQNELRNQQPQPPDANRQANNPPRPNQPQPGQTQPSQPQAGQQQSPDRQANNPQPQPGQQQQPDNQASNQPQPGQSPQPSQPQQGQQQAGTPQQQPGQQPEGSQNQQSQSGAAAALAAAEAALRQELAQTQQQNGQNQGQQQAGNQQQQGQQQGQQGQQNQPGQQQAANQQNGQGQPQPGQGQQQGQQQPGQGQQQQQGQGQQTAQTGKDGQSPNANQQQGNQQGQGAGDAQNQIAGHGPDSGDPAQVVGSLRRDEREAFTALQGERYPAEYSAWVQQYWRNLAQEQ
ncbi:MAG: hypothetical protein ABW223_10055 [Rariglobus sp.]